MVGASPSKSSTGTVEAGNSWLHAPLVQFGFMWSALPQPVHTWRYLQVIRLQPSGPLLWSKHAGPPPSPLPPPLAPPPFCFSLPLPLFFSFFRTAGWAAGGAAAAAATVKARAFRFAAAVRFLWPFEGRESLLAASARSARWERGTRHHRECLGETWSGAGQAFRFSAIDAEGLRKLGVHELVVARGHPECLSNISAMIHVPGHLLPDR